MNTIQCTNCFRPYPQKGVPHRCPSCSGVYDFTEVSPIEPDRIEPELPGIWRYRYTFGLTEGSPVISLAEGDTPLVWSEVFSKRVAFKLEYLNPTGSFKDRGTAPLISFLKSRKVDEAVEDSSGNAGSSFAAYAARAGIKARVYVPESASGPKRTQIHAYGAEVVRVPGPRSNSSSAVIHETEKGTVYASHVYMPYGLPGFATIAYEIIDQIGGAPGSVIAPVGHGSLILGVGRGFTALKRAGMVSTPPVLVGVQARACAPLWALSSFGSSSLGRIAEGQTVAEGICIQYPVRGDAVVQIVEKSKGKFVAVDEDEILPGLKQLARRGYFVEPTSATVWAVLEQVVRDLPEPIVVILTGSGIKSDLDLILNQLDWRKHHI